MELENLTAESETRAFGNNQEHGLQDRQSLDAGREAREGQELKRVRGNNYVSDINEDTEGVNRFGRVMVDKGLNYQDWDSVKNNYFLFFWNV